MKHYNLDQFTTRAVRRRAARRDALISAAIGAAAGLGLLAAFGML